MAARTDQAHAERLEQVLALVREKVPAEARGPVEAFVRAYYRQVDADDLAERAPADLYGAALSHWNFARRREPGKPQRARLQPERRRSTAGSRRTRRRDRQRRHAVPRRLGDDGGEPPRAHAPPDRPPDHPGEPARSDGARSMGVLPDDSPAGSRESFMHVEVDRITDAGAHGGARRRPRARARRRARRGRGLEDDARQGARDRRRPRAPPAARRPEELAEARAFLEWLAADHFTFLGYRCHDLVMKDGDDALAVVPGSGLGILREKPGDELADELLAAAAAGARLRAREGSADRHQGELALDRAPAGLPRLHRHQALRRPRRGLRRAPLPRPLHPHRVPRAPGRDPAAAAQGRERPRARGLRARRPRRRRRSRTSSRPIPRDELFQIAEDELLETALGILHLGERQRFRLFVRRDPFERFVSCLIYAPRENYNTELRQQVAGDPDARRSTASRPSSTSFLSESVLARIHDHGAHDARARSRSSTCASSRARLAAAARRWEDDLREALSTPSARRAATSSAAASARRFPAAYREDVPARNAVPDMRDDGEGRRRAASSG